MKKIYLDHSATTPLDPSVLEVMKPYLETEYGNPSSIHSFGQASRAAVEEARTNIAKILNCSTNEIIFTSGGTESDNLALRGIPFGAALSSSWPLAGPAAGSSPAQAFAGGPLRRRHPSIRPFAYPPHVIISSIEHHAVLDTAEDLRDTFGVELDLVPVDKTGVVKIEDVKKLIKENTALVSLMYANNEMGTVQPVAEIGAMLKDVNQNRKNRIYLHTDAVQAAGHLDLDVTKLGVDALTLSAHKFYGPKGVGILYLKSKTPFRSVMSGGGQEHNLRSGTENVAGIVGMGAAITRTQGHKDARTQKLRDRLSGGVLKSVPDVELVGDKKNRLPNIASFIFKDISAETLLIALDMEGIAVSSGSACTVGSVEPSHVLKAMGYSNEDSKSMIRFSLGKNNTEDEIDYVLEKLPPLVSRLRKL